MFVVWFKVCLCFLAVFFLNTHSVYNSPSRLFGMHNEPYFIAAIFHSKSHLMTHLLTAVST